MYDFTSNDYIVLVLFYITKCSWTLRDSGFKTVSFIYSNYCLNHYFKRTQKLKVIKLSFLRLGGQVKYDVIADRFSLSIL